MMVSIANQNATPNVIKGKEMNTKMVKSWFKVVLTIFGFGITVMLPLWAVYKVFLWLG